jgi:uncharacterized protein YciU (UPF0263 family)
MRYIRTYESFNKKGVKMNEEFIGNFLKGLVPDWLKNINVKNKKSIDKALEDYKIKYEQATKDLSAIIDSKGEIDKERLKKVQLALEKKRDLLTKDLNTKMSSLTKDSEKSRDYANLKRNAIELKIVESELEQYQKAGLEENEYTEALKKNSLEVKKKKEEAEKKLKRDSAKEVKKETSRKVTKENLTPGEILLYKNKNDERSIVKITDDGNIQRISTTLTKDEYEEEMKKPEDQKNLVGLFKKEEGTPFLKPHNDEYERLVRISKGAQDSFMKKES